MSVNEELQTSQAELHSLNEELDALTHDLERCVERRTAHLRLLQDAAILANSARSLEEAAAAVLERICRFGGWAAGHAWWVRENGALEPSEAWYVRPAAEEHGAALRETVGGRTLPPGAGLPGRVAASGEALSTVLGPELDDPRLVSLQGGPLGTVVAFPVLVGDEVVGVLELLGAHAGEPRAGLLELMVDVGTQLGRVVERDRADRKLAELTFQEQQRLGEELHEGLGQRVSALAMLARSLHKRLAARSAPEAELAGQLEENLQAARSQVHRVSKGLMPVRLLESGLPGVLGTLAEEVRDAHPVDCHLEVAPGLEIRDDRVATALYRIAREAVNNALLHAEASRISIRLLRNGEGGLALVVEDDGTGLQDGTPEGGGLGLRIMRDRASLVQGELAVKPGEQGGTRVECRVQEGGFDGSP
ncbi:MAG: GAF domain-containing sensor histidine kinase, partial [Acidobacteriota bacterium]